MKKLKSKAPIDFVCLLDMYKTLTFKVFLIHTSLAFKDKPRRYFYVIYVDFWIS